MPMSLPGQEELWLAQPHKTATPGMGRKKRDGEVTLGWEEVEKANSQLPLESRPPGFKSQSTIYQLRNFGRQFSRLTWENLLHRASGESHEMAQWSPPYSVS